MLIVGKIVGNECFEYAKDGEIHQQPTGRVMIDTEENAFAKWSKNVRMGMLVILIAYILAIAVLLVDYVHLSESEGITYEQLCYAANQIQYSVMGLVGLPVFIFNLFRENKGMPFGILAGTVLIYVHCRFHMEDFFEWHSIICGLCFFGALYVALWIIAQICVQRDWRLRHNQIVESAGENKGTKLFGRYIFSLENLESIAVEMCGQCEVRENDDTQK